MYYLKLPTRPSGVRGWAPEGLGGGGVVDAFEKAAVTCSSDSERWVLPPIDQEFQYADGEGQTVRSRKIVLVHQHLRKRWGRWGRLVWKKDGLKIESHYHVRLDGQYREIELDLKWLWSDVNDLKDPKVAIIMPYFTATFDAVSDALRAAIADAQKAS